MSGRATPDATDYEYLQWWADRYNVAIGLPESAPDPQEVRLPNRSWENAGLNNGAWNSGVPSGWTEATSTVVQNMTAAQMADESRHGANVLILNSDSGRARWAMDDNWGNLVRFGAAQNWRLSLEVWVGRRSDSQGVDAGVLEVSIQNAAGDRVESETFALDGVPQGTWARREFVVDVDASLVASGGAGEQMYLAVENVVEGMPSSREGRVLIDDLRLSIEVLDDPCPADLADPPGVLDIDDVLSFLGAFSAGDPAADLAPPGGDGQLDIDDVLTFLVRVRGRVCVMPVPAGLARPPDRSRSHADASDPASRLSPYSPGAK